MGHAISLRTVEDTKHMKVWRLLLPLLLPLPMLLTLPLLLPLLLPLPLPFLLLLILILLLPLLSSCYHRLTCPLTRSGALSTT